MEGDILFLDGSDRYGRLRLINWWDQSKLRAAKVLVAGAGAIGNEVLKNLALLGIGHVFLIDLDLIEASNLARSVLFRAEDCGQSKAFAAARAVQSLNPDVRVKPIQGNVLTDLGLGLFRDVDVVIGALDNREARLWLNRCCWKVGTPWIDGGIQEISGVVKVFNPPDSACYECGMTDNDYRLINLRYSCSHLAHDQWQAGKVPTTSTIASIIGGLQVQEALKLLHGLPAAEGQALIWNGLANNFYKTAFQRRDDCLSHETYPEPFELPLAAAEATAADLFTAVGKYFGGSRELMLSLDRDLLVSLDCECGHSRRIMKPQQVAVNTSQDCPACGKLIRPRMEHVISAASPLAKERLKDLGVPPYDIVRVTDGKSEQMFLLVGDRERIMGSM